MASAVLALAYGAAPSLAATPGFGSCVGTDGTDCTAAVGHATVSIVSTLSVNEMRGISFGNLAFGGGATPTTSDTVILETDGTRTSNSTNFTLLNGTDATTAGDPGAQHPGHYTISGGAEGAATEVYISFADNTGAPMDMCDASATPICDSYHPNTFVTLTGPGGATLRLHNFTINEDGSNVYGHFITFDGSSPAPGITNPFDPANHSGTVSGSATADVVVGATLTGNGNALAAGKYEGTFQIMASY